MESTEAPVQRCGGSHVLPINVNGRAYVVQTRLSTWQWRVHASWWTAAGRNYRPTNYQEYSFETPQDDPFGELCVAEQTSPSISVDRSVLVDAVQSAGLHAGCGGACCMPEVITACRWQIQLASENRRLWRHCETDSRVSEHEADFHHITMLNTAWPACEACLQASRHLRANLSTVASTGGRLPSSDAATKCHGDSGSVGRITLVYCSAHISYLLVNSSLTLQSGGEEHSSAWLALVEYHSVSVSRQHRRP